MKFFRVIGRSIRDAFKSFGRNISLSLASITCVIVTLIMVGLALVITYNVENISETIKKNLEIVVFISNDAKDDAIETLAKQIKALDNVDQATVTFKSKSEIKQDMMDSDEKWQNIMEDWDEKENPLQNTYIVRLIDANKIAKTASEIKKLSNVTLVKYGEGTVEQLLIVANGIEKSSFVAVVALVIVTVFLIINTIKLTIFSRKREISIMRLVGASNISIKLPFIFEGMFIGLAGAIIPVVVVVYGYYWIYDVLDGKLFSDIIMLIKPSLIVFKISLFVVAIGGLVGMVGSASAVRKYLKI